MRLTHTMIDGLWHQSLQTLQRLGFSGPDEVRQLCERLGYWPVREPERRTLDVDVLRPKVMEAIANGCTVRDIAEQLGVSTTSVCYLINKRPFRKR